MALIQYFEADFLQPKFSISILSIESQPQNIEFIADSSSFSHLFSVSLMTMDQT